jgi:hypothetical protein
VDWHGRLRTEQEQVRAIWEILTAHDHNFHPIPGILYPLWARTYPPCSSLLLDFLDRTPPFSHTARSNTIPRSFPGGPEPCARMTQWMTVCLTLACRQYPHKARSLSHTESSGISAAFSLPLHTPTTRVTRRNPTIMSVGWGGRTDALKSRGGGVRENDIAHAMRDIRDCHYTR